MARTLANHDRQNSLREDVVPLLRVEGVSRHHRAIKDDGGDLLRETRPRPLHAEPCAVAVVAHRMHHHMCAAAERMRRLGELSVGELRKAHLCRADRAPVRAQLRIHGIHL